MRPTPAVVALLLLLAAATTTTTAQRLPPILPLPSVSGLLAPRVAAVSDAVEAANAAVDDRTFVQLNGTALGDGVVVPATREVDTADADACRAACAAAPGCYGATYTERLEFYVCQLFGGGDGANPCAPVILSASDIAVSFLFPGAATAAAARCKLNDASAPPPPSPSAAVRAAADLCARAPRLCASPTGRRRHLAATPIQDAGAAGWGMAVDARHAAATLHGVTVVLPDAGPAAAAPAPGDAAAAVPTPPSTLEYLGTVSGVPNAKTCEGYCQQLIQGADNGDEGTLIPVTPFDSSPYGDAPYNRMAVATGRFQATCLAASWYELSAATGNRNTQHGHVCDLFGPAPRGDTMLVLAPTRAGAAATTSVRAARWSQVVGWYWSWKQEQPGE